MPASQTGKNRGGRKANEMTSDMVKAELIKLMATGMLPKDACEVLGRSVSTYRWHRRDDPEFKRKADEARRLAGTDQALEAPVVPDFAEFREKYLHQKTFAHQQQWVDLLEGREPSDLHPSMDYHLGRPTRLIVNVPPGHAKSTTITSDYVTWRIVKNPSVRVIIVSKAQRLAEQFLLQIKERLTSPQYAELAKDFGPPGGWDSDSAGWSASRFYVSSKVRGAEAKDPTVQALGIGGQIYGARADLVILDDVVDTTNSQEFDKQIQWTLSMVASRLAPRSGRLLVIGTRIAPRDLYSELQDPSRYHKQESPWTYLRQPAVLEYAEDPKDWVTLWPKSDQPNDIDELPDEDGLYPRWDGPTLSDVRDGISASEWARLYQQEQVSEETVFKPEEVNACLGGYSPGHLTNSPNLGRDGGADGLRLVMGLDPAVAGYTAAVLIGLDRQTGHRWVIDMHNESGMTPDRLRAFIKTWVDQHHLHEIRVEGNAFQRFLTMDRELNDFCASRGVVLHEHYTTGSNKHDPVFGVAAMTHLFRQQLISLPQPRTEAARALTEQLLTWDPAVAQSKQAKRGHKTDLVMALWFAELRCQELVAGHGGQSHGTNMFQTRWDRSQQRVYTPQDVNNGNVSASPRMWR